MVKQKDRKALKVVIVGGGISAVAQAVRLEEAFGKNVQFTIYERASEFGGVWRDSTWPGTAVDIPSHLYCLYSEPNPWFKSKWGFRDEILGYWQGIVKRHRLAQHFVFNTTFVRSEWDEIAQQHRITFKRTNGNEFAIEADVMISATGALNRPIIPRLPGIDDFKGVQFHSSRWRNDIDFKGKQIAVVGNGSSGIQCIPHLAEIEGVQLTQFIRSPGYFRPKENFEYPRWKQLVFRYVPFALRTYRYWLFWEYDRAILSRGLGWWSTKLRENMTTSIVNYMKSKAPEEYWPAILPDYPMHCKRVAFNAGWLESLNRPNVHLTSSPIESLEENGIVTADGKHHLFDIVIWATGFEVANTGTGLNHGVHGEDGLELNAIWNERNGAYGYWGIACPKIPNYFVVLGPNSIAQNWGWTLGNNTALIARILKEAYDRNLSSIVIKDSAIDEYNEYLTSRLQSTSLASPVCGRSWYKHPKTGKLVAPAPWTATELWTRVRKTKWEDWKCRRREEEGGSALDGKAVVVEIKSPRTWTPWGLVVDAFAARVQSYLVGLMNDA